MQQFISLGHNLGIQSVPLGEIWKPLYLKPYSHSTTFEEIMAVKS